MAEHEPGPVPAAAGRRLAPGLHARCSGDGSFSLWSEAFGEGFHSGRGALREARETFLIPSQLERFRGGSPLRVLEVCVGTGSNLAVLLEACADQGLPLEWTGLELDPMPLRLALEQPTFRAPWRAATLTLLERLLEQGAWDSAAGAEPGRDGQPLQAGCAPGADSPADTSPAADATGCRTAGRRHAAVQPAPPGDHSPSRGRMLWGDARQALPWLLKEHSGSFDLIWHDAFSPQRCPQLWSLEFLTGLAALLKPEGRWISYCSAAAVREALRLAGLQLVALPSPSQPANRQQCWSGGTIASPSELPESGPWRALTLQEQEHLACTAAEPYRDPTGSASSQEILTTRQQAQADALARSQRVSSSHWRRRWGLERSTVQPDAAASIAQPDQDARLR